MSCLTLHEIKINIFHLQMLFHFVLNIVPYLKEHAVLTSTNFELSCPDLTCAHHIITSPPNKMIFDGYNSAQKNTIHVIPLHQSTFPLLQHIPNHCFPSQTLGQFSFTFLFLTPFNSRFLTYWTPALYFPTCPSNKPMSFLSTRLKNKENIYYISRFWVKFII